MPGRDIIPAAESLKPEGQFSLDRQSADDDRRTGVNSSCEPDVGEEADLCLVIDPQEVHIIPDRLRCQVDRKLRACNRIAIDDDVFDATFNVEIGHSPVEIMPGMTCDVIVTARFNPEALTLPSEVIFDDPSGSGAKLVYLQTDGGHAEVRTVTVGLMPTTPAPKFSMASQPGIWS